MSEIKDINKRFELLQETVNEKKENMSNISAQLKFKREELATKGKELKDLGINFTDAESLSNLYTETKESVTDKLDKLEELLGIEDDNSSVTDLDDFSDVFADINNK